MVQQQGEKKVYRVNELAENTAPNKHDKKQYIWNKQPVLRARQSKVATILCSIVIPAIMLVMMEWVARDGLGQNKDGTGFFEALGTHFLSFAIAYVLLVAGYVFISQLTGLHALAAGIVGVTALLPGVVTHYKLTMRGEPFLPWDLSQINDLLAVKSNLEFVLPKKVIVAGAVFLLCIILAMFVKLPRGAEEKSKWVPRFIAAGVALAAGTGLVLGVFLNAAGSKAIGIQEDMWMQNRYYRTHGVITGFLTNLQMLKIAEPKNYDEQAITQLEEEILAKGHDKKPYYEASLQAGAAEIEQTPDIIYVMAEGFWDMTRLPGVEYDQPLMQNIERLKQEGAYGYGYSPSFGGGTCDVEFEALTGFSQEFLPAGSKPFQQYITKNTFSLPWVLKGRGYDTLAIHGYGRKFWNRDTAYPRLGIDEFIAAEDFVKPEKRRGFISDNAMVDRIIEEYNKRQDTPVFIHAVTMQNHTTYSPDRYPAGELVKVTKAPAAFTKDVIGQVEDCATGIREMDAALGKLTDYLRTTDRPTIVAFWGDHLNPMSNGTGIFEDSGFVTINKTPQDDAKMRQVPLLIWSNYTNKPQDLGTIGTYNISPVVMDLYGLEKPTFFEYLTQQLDVLHVRSQGITIGGDNTIGIEVSQAQQEALDEHETMQYDYLFGKQFSENYVPE